MLVKGTAFLARVDLLEAKLGSAEAVDDFLATYRAHHPAFPASVLPTTLIPAEEFLILVDTIVDEFFDGDRHSLWDVGRASAEWSLRHGPYKALLELGEIDRFVAMAPVMWSNFFDVGSACSQKVGNRIELRIEGVPKKLRHPYFEFSVVGYFERGLQLLGASVTRECVQSFVGGDAVVHYDLRVAE